MQCVVCQEDTVEEGSSVKVAAISRLSGSIADMVRAAERDAAAKREERTDARGYRPTPARLEGEYPKSQAHANAERLIASMGAFRASVQGLNRGSSLVFPQESQDAVKQALIEFKTRLKSLAKNDFGLLRDIEFVGNPKYSGFCDGGQTYAFFVPGSIVGLMSSVDPALFQKILKQNQEQVSEQDRVFLVQNGIHPSDALEVFVEPINKTGEESQEPPSLRYKVSLQRSLAQVKQTTLQDKISAERVRLMHEIRKTYASDPEKYKLLVEEAARRTTELFPKTLEARRLETGSELSTVEQTQLKRNLQKDFIMQLLEAYTGGEAERVKEKAERNILGFSSSQDDLSWNSDDEEAAQTIRQRAYRSWWQDPSRRENKSKFFESFLFQPGSGSCIALLFESSKKHNFFLSSSVGSSLSLGRLALGDGWFSREEDKGQSGEDPVVSGTEKILRLNASLASSGVYSRPNINMPLRNPDELKAALDSLRAERAQYAKEKMISQVSKKFETREDLLKRVTFGSPWKQANFTSVSDLVERDLSGVFSAQPYGYLFKLFVFPEGGRRTLKVYPLAIKVPFYAQHLADYSDLDYNVSLENFDSQLSDFEFALETSPETDFAPAEGLVGRNARNELMAFLSIKGDFILQYIHLFLRKFCAPQKDILAYSYQVNGVEYPVQIYGLGGQFGVANVADFKGVM